MYLCVCVHIQTICTYPTLIPAVTSFAPGLSGYPAVTVDQCIQALEDGVSFITDIYPSTSTLHQCFCYGHIWTLSHHALHFDTHEVSVHHTLSTGDATAILMDSPIISSRLRDADYMEALSKYTLSLPFEMVETSIIFPEGTCMYLFHLHLTSKRTNERDTHSSNNPITGCETRLHSSM